MPCFQRTHDTGVCTPSDPVAAPSRRQRFIDLLTAHLECSDTDGGVPFSARKNHDAADWLHAWALQNDDRVYVFATEAGAFDVVERGTGRTIAEYRGWAMGVSS